VVHDAGHLVVPKARRDHLDPSSTRAGVVDGGPGVVPVLVGPLTDPDRLLG